MELADRLVRALTDPSFQLKVERSDPSQMSDEELSLLPAAHRVGRSSMPSMMTARSAVQDLGKERQPRYTPDACRRMFEALVTEGEARNWADLTLGRTHRCAAPVRGPVFPARPAH